MIIKRLETRHLDWNQTHNVVGVLVWQGRRARNKKGKRKTLWIVWSQRSFALWDNLWLSLYICVNLILRYSTHSTLIFSNPFHSRVSFYIGERSRLYRFCMILCRRERWQGFNYNAIFFAGPSFEMLLASAFSLSLSFNLSYSFSRSPLEYTKQSGSSRLTERQRFPSMAVLDSIPHIVVPFNPLSLSPPFTPRRRFDPWRLKGLRTTRPYTFSRTPRQEAPTFTYKSACKYPEGTCVILWAFLHRAILRNRFICSSPKNVKFRKFNIFQTKWRFFNFINSGVFSSKKIQNSKLISSIYNREDSILLVSFAPSFLSLYIFLAFQPKNFSWTHNVTTTSSLIYSREQRGDLELKSRRTFY